MSETFWDIIQVRKIEIPEIQRDYAQGRINKRVDTIRKYFVSDLLDAISTGNKLNLDFVFGQAVDRINQANFNKSKHSLEQMLEVLKKYSEEAGVSFKSEVAPKQITSNNNNLLIPIDGQQRLTTLFLLHLFIGAKAGRDISSLMKFSYKTRESSSIITEHLVKNKSLITSFCPHQSIAEKSRENISISACLKNQPWFFSSWKKDPTVAGMLVMLDEIEKQVFEKDINVEKAWNNLVEERCVEFDFFDIKEKGFDDDLYVKMNARGKGLTDFENFRAWLEKKQKNNQILKKYDWVNKLDKEWLDLFWKTKTKVSDVDINFMALFKNMALVFKLSKSKGVSDKKYGKERDLIHLLKPKDFTSTSQYEQHHIFTEDSLRFIFKVLDIITADKNGKLNSVIKEVWTTTFNNRKDESFTKLLLTDFDGLNLYHKTFFFAVLRFLIINQKFTNDYAEEDWVKLKNWLRVARNIIYNSRIDDDTAYVPAIISLSKLRDAVILNTHKELIKIITNEDKKKWITFYNREQQEEECNKIAILCEKENTTKWNELIHTAENHLYFYGQIDFIFKLAKNDITEFETYLNKLIKLFCEDNISSNEYILQSAFFAFDDSDNWLVNLSANRYMFYKSAISNSRDRNENWRIVFNDNRKRNILKALLNHSTCELDDIQDLINTRKNELSYDDWKYYILDEPTLLEYCGNAIYTRTPYSNKVRLLEKTLNSSKQRELRSFHFYKKQKKQVNFQFPPFKDFWYYTGERGSINPCVVYGAWFYNGVEYFIDCRFESSGFVLNLNRRTEGEIDSEIEKKLYQNHGFNKDKSLMSPTIIYKDLESKVKGIMITLNEINSNSHE